jgi:hypothetical protein
MKNSGTQTIITKHVKAEALMLSKKDFCNLLKKQQTLTELFHRSPMQGAILDTEKRKEDGKVFFWFT